MAKTKDSGIGAGGAAGVTTGAGGGASADGGGAAVEVAPSLSIPSQFNATEFTQSEWKQHYDDQNPTDKQKKYTAMYINPKATSTGYSPSQNMNYKIDKGMNLSPQQKAMRKTMEDLASPLGHDSILHRGAHAGALEQLGLKDWTGMSETQLKEALVGAEWDKKSFTSTSYDYDASPFLSGSKAGGREVIFRMHVKGDTKATCVNPSQAEVVLSQNTHWKITDAAYTGKKATPQATWPKQWDQIVIDVDVWQ